ncbi:3-phosphoinositide-dependent protein kinase 1-like isoform X3 [Artemia franciscana]|uniref:3-phosphoinositide-dependent protein kinase 1-like isoform X3 n=1 Tax=Artemia franciscana TaxID=6661 RepID=UPI0032DB2A5B
MTENLEAPPMKRSANDFIFGKVLGEGSFSTVFLAKDVHTSKEFAIKVCQKRHIIREKKQDYVKREKETLLVLSKNVKESAPYFVRLYCTFQDPESLYFVLTYAKKGDLLGYLNKVGSFEDHCSKFYGAEIVQALEHLHCLGIVHRDLKPENILLSESMHIVITDFGSAKILNCVEMDEKNKENSEEDAGELKRKSSFVGTAQYVSPEILNRTRTTPSCDLWALGCIIYQMVAGLPPFRGHDYAIFQKIMKLEYEYPDGFPDDARDIVTQLLVLEPSERLGAKDIGSYTSVKSHPFFSGLDFEELHKVKPPEICPHLVRTESSSSFEIPSDAQPGLGANELSRALGLPLAPSRKSSTVTRSKLSIADLDETEREKMLEGQKENKFNQFVENNVILKQGFIDKRVGLFSRRRMLLLTTGPHLYYVDSGNMVLKGEIPWSLDLKTEAKNFKTFFVYTPNRTYYLEDPTGFALEWCKAIDDVRNFYFRSNAEG